MKNTKLIPKHQTGKKILKFSESFGNAQIAGDSGTGTAARDTFSDDARRWSKKYQRGGLVHHQYSGTWGNRGKGNELQSALENGLSWIGDKIINAGDYVDQGLSYLAGLIPGGMTAEESLQDEKNKQMARKRGDKGYINHYGEYKLFPLTGIAPSPGYKKPSAFDWDDLYNQTLARTKITTTSPARMHWFRKAANTDDRFLAGRQVTSALENSKDFAGYQAHGMAKGSDGEMLARLRTILRYGINPNKNFYTSPVGKIDPMARVHMGTASGHAYSDGPFMLLTKDLPNIARPGAFSHVLINSGMGDEALELANKYKTVLSKEFPNVKFLLYNEVK